MFRFAPAAVLACILVCCSVAAEAETMHLAQTQVTQTVQRPVTRLQKVKARTKETWAQMKHRFTLQRERWRDCRKQAKSLRLAGRKTRQFLEDCMTAR